MDQQERKLPLPAFLKILTSNNVPVPKAMAVASKVCVLLYQHVSSRNDPHIYNLRYKEFNTTSLLAQLTDGKLIRCGVEDKETRKAVLVAIRKAGHTAQPSSVKPKKNESKGSGAQPVAGPSQPKVANTVQILVSRLCRSVQDSHADLHRPRRLRRKGSGSTIQMSSFLRDLRMKLLRMAAWNSTRY